MQPQLRHIPDHLILSQPSLPGSPWPDRNAALARSGIQAGECAISEPVKQPVRQRQVHAAELAMVLDQRVKRAVAEKDLARCHLARFIAAPP